MISIKVVSFTYQYIFCDNIYLDADADGSVISSITTKEGTDYDDVSSLSENDTIRLSYGRRNGCQNKI